MPDYDYNVKQFSLLSGSLQPSTNSVIRVSAVEIEMETELYWWIYLPANYHDSFYHETFDSSRAIPTQVTGGVGEAFALVMMRKLYDADQVDKIMPHPSSKSADFEMKIIENGRKVHALVESKSSNNLYYHRPPKRIIFEGAWQLVKTNSKVYANSGFLIITSYPAKTCFIIKVF